jgi:hypothetical protein
VNLVFAVDTRQDANDTTQKLNATEKLTILGIGRAACSVQRLRSFF